jgi:hypothetical protein
MEEYFKSDYYKSSKRIIDTFKPPLVPMTPRKPKNVPPKIYKKEEVPISVQQNLFYDYVFLQTFS